MIDPVSGTGLLAEFHLLRPLWLLGIIPALISIAALWRINSTVSAWDRAIDKSLLPYLLDKNKNVAQRTPLMLLLLVWMLSIIALSGPVWERLPQPVQKRDDALVIVFDLSLSMFASDLEPSRLDAAKRKLIDILRIRNEGQTALIVYAGDAHTVTPLTDDSVTIEALIPSLNPNIMPALGSNPAAAIDLAKTLLSEAGVVKARILLVTDGIEVSDQDAIGVRLESENIELSVLGVGTEEGAPIPMSDGSLFTDQNGNVVRPSLNRSSLQALASRLSGRYHDIEITDADIEYLLADNSLLDDDNLSEVEKDFDIWYETGPWLLLLILPLVALSFRRGWLFTAVVTVTFSSSLLIPTAQVQALEWKDLWKTRDQQGADAYMNDDAEAAANLFDSSGWRGTANYRVANYEAAIDSFSSIDSPDGHYNRGNALALSGSYEEAIAAYDVAIGMQDNHEDAIFNREIVQKLLEQQESEEQDSEQDSDQQSQQQSSENQPEDEQQSEDQDQQSEEGEEQDQEQQQENQEQEEQENQPQGEMNQQSDSNQETEEQESLEQWLRRIEDDPGELLRRKFQYQYRKRQLEGRSRSSQSASGKIW